MKKWVLKATVQKAISWLPASQRINFLFQKYITGGVRLTDHHFTDKLIHATDHVFYQHKYGKKSDFKVLELGSGWYPIVPVALFLSGAEAITSMDISPLMTREAILKTLRKYREWQEQDKLRALQPYIRKERWEQLIILDRSDLSMEDLLEALHLELLVKDARATGFEANTFDLVCSNNTFEHIYPSLLKDILAEFKRVIHPEGIMSHFIDMSDHFAHLDRSISIYNFLRYSPAQWSRIDNSVQPQNRLRLKDYEAMYADLGLKILDRKIRPGSIETVRQTPLYETYASYTEAEIAVSHAHLVSTS